jgi:hypothetical protein
MPVSRDYSVSNFSRFFAAAPARNVPAAVRVRIRPTMAMNRLCKAANQDGLKWIAGDLTSIP